MGLPFADVTFAPDRRGHRQPVEVRILEREWAHDTAIITMPFEKKNKKKYAHGAPVVIRYGWQPDDVEHFFGYVHHADRHDEQSNPGHLDIYCIAASYRFRSIRLRSFRQRSVAQIAAQIAKEHRFSILVQGYARIFPSLAQHGRSDWDFLASLAKRIGFTLYAHKTDLVMVKRQIDTTAKRWPTFRLRPAHYNARATCYSLDVKVGDSLPKSARQQHIAMGLSDNNTVVRAVAKPVTTGSGTTELPDPAWWKRSEWPVHDVRTAQQTVQGEAAGRSFAVRAEAALSGNTKVHQGSTVRIVAADSDSDGLWWVSQVEHRITRKDYRLQTILERDALGDIVAKSPSLVSDSGKPVVLTDCDVSVTSAQAPAPDTLYSPVDECMPVENLEVPDSIAPLQTVVDGPFVSPARKVIASRVPSRVAVIERKIHRLDAWRAAQHIVRIKAGG